MSGKVILVTGGNAGIGLAVIRQLVRHGAKVYMAARSEQRAKAAIERLHAEDLNNNTGEVVWLNLDLSDPRNVQRAAEELMQKEERLDVLINNAAALLIPFAKDFNNVQNIVMINYIGTCVLTLVLLPLLKRTAQQPHSDVRIVAVNSNGHKSCPVDVRFRNLDDLNRDFADTMFPQFLRYAFSKTMQLMFIKELQRRLDDDSVPILCMGLDPGEVNTEGVQSYTQSVGPILGPLYRLIALLTFASPSLGAHSTLYCASSLVPRAKPIAHRGAYFDRRGNVAQCSKVVANPESRAELWDTTMRLLHNIGLELPEV